MIHRPILRIAACALFGIACVAAIWYAVDEPAPVQVANSNDLDASVGKRVEFRGLAGSNKRGQFVSIDGVDIYISPSQFWPPGVEGSRVRITGTLKMAGKIDPKIPLTKEQRANEPVDYFVIKGSRWSLAE
jgi:hypothetical protein